jgi:deazaflavin-dependent oxidoreductase (nitroreductase family)
MVSQQIQQALAHDRTVDITTVGRRSGQPRRIEIWFHSLDGRVYISGLPGRRGWYANIVAHPDFVFHLKETTQAALPARARPITDPAERRSVLSGLLAGIGREGALEDWVDRSPLIEVELLGREDAA